MRFFNILALFLAAVPFAELAEKFGPAEQATFLRQTYLQNIADFAKDYFEYNKDDLIVHFTNITTTRLVMPPLTDLVDPNPHGPYNIYNYAAENSILQSECNYDLWHGENHTAGRLYIAAPKALFYVQAALGDHGQFFQVGWGVSFFPLLFNATNFNLGTAEYDNFLDVVIRDMMFSNYLSDTVIGFTAAEFIDKLNKNLPSGRYRQRESSGKRFTIERLAAAKVGTGAFIYKREDKTEARMWRSKSE